jgi:hypothetical protein
VQRLGLRAQPLEAVGVEDGGENNSGTCAESIIRGADASYLDVLRLEATVETRVTSLERLMSDSLCDEESAASLLTEGGGRRAVSRPVTRYRQAFRPPRTVRLGTGMSAHGNGRAQKSAGIDDGRWCALCFELLNPAADLPQRVDGAALHRKLSIRFIHHPINRGALV